MKINAGAVDPKDLDGRILDGKHHLLVTAIDERGGKDGDKLVVDYEVLNSTNVRNIGRKGREQFATSEKAMPRVIALAIALGLTTVEEMDLNNRTGKDTDLNFALGVNRTFCGETKRKDQYVNLTYMGIWADGSEEARDVPKAGKTATPAGGGGAGGTPGVGGGEDIPF